MGAIELLARRSRAAVLVGAVALVLVLGVVDQVTGPELDFSIFYLIPISLTAWLVGRDAALGVSIASVFVLAVAEQLSPSVYSHPVFAVWNAGLRFGFFLIVAASLAALRRATDNESRLARTDPLTGAANGRAFREAAARELQRAQRYGQTFTVASLDIDDFKAINDRLGHGAGDALLRAVAETIRSSLRAVDTVARMGGDEFALLLPETGHDPAGVVLRKLVSALVAVTARNGWPVTFSIGAVTCTGPSCSVDELLKVADDHMYAVKRSGKNGIRQVVLG